MQQGHGTTTKQAAGSVGALCSDWVINKERTHQHHGAPSARILLKRTLLLLSDAGWQWGGEVAPSRPISPLCKETGGFYPQPFSKDSRQGCMGRDVDLPLIQLS